MIKEINSFFERKITSPTLFVYKPIASRAQTEDIYAGCNVMLNMRYWQMFYIILFALLEEVITPSASA